MTAGQPEHKTFDVAIVGSGFSGMGMAIKLKQEGTRDFVVLERADDVGGTWHYNTYPGCACDVPSHLYSFSFAPNPRWTETYSKQPEIRAYLQRVADDFGLRPHVRFGHTVETAAWNEQEKLWEIQTDKGTMRARVLVAGMGPLAEPKVPELPGLEDFEGAVFHSARWDHDWDPKGKRVASIGTGASAIQYVPELQPDVEQLHVFQRTPPWVFPHNNRPVKDWERRLYSRSKLAQRLMRGSIYSGREVAVLGFVKNPKLMRVAERMAKRHMRSQISDPDLLAKVKPDYTIGCKRILPSNKWYPALGEPNVELVTSGVKEVKRNSVVDEDGVEREVDAIVFGTGFAVTDMPVAKQVRGRDGRTLDELWQGSPRAHLGLTVAGYPNFFLLLGPNTGLGHNSMVYMIESQLAHVMEALRAMDKSGADTIEVRQDVLDGYNAAIEEQLEGTVWNTGCKSWYLDANGRNSTLWPDWTWRFRRRAAEFKLSEYRLGSA
ncbi:MAG TPA: NAD(P)/FAD-dependent oxidoreductase [Thermoleophilaceae bacterium]